MNEAANEKNATTEEEIEESFSQLPLVKRRATKNHWDSSHLRYRRQKFCTRWLKEFPWVKADQIDESVGTCTVCNTKLVCKKSHLERHQKSFKHQRLQGYDDMRMRTDDDSIDPTATEFLECGKRDPDELEAEFGNEIELEHEQNMEFELKPEHNLKGFGKERRSQRSISKLRPKPSSSANKIDRLQLLKRIDRDRNELNTYYYSRRGHSPHSATAHAPLAQRDSFDLFFESVSASVKMLPPKMAAEVKSRVSQIIAEFELRAISEREAEVKNDASARVVTVSSASDTALVAASTTHESSPTVTQQTGIDPESGLQHIVYTFEPKVRDC